jgi:hypothetical protein
MPQAEMRHVTFIALTASCTPPAATAAVANHTPPPRSLRRPSCPGEPSAIVRGWVRAELKDLRVDCVGGNFPAPGWFIDAIYERDGQATETLGIAATEGDRDLIAPVEDEISRVQFDGTTATYYAVDLDGDGIDEIVRSSRWSENGFVDVMSYVLQVHGSAIDVIQGPLVASDDSGVNLRASGLVAWCDGALSIQGRHVVITVKRQLGRPDGCLGVGEHVFELHGGKLVETNVQPR